MIEATDGSAMPSTSIRQNVLPQATRVVVKIGTQLLTKRGPAGAGAGTRGSGRTSRSTSGGGGGGLCVDAAFVRRMAKQIAGLHERGVAVTLVSSGAVGAGCAELKLAKRPTDVADAQAVAAVGQRRLMTHWHNAFTKLGLGVGQVLLTRTDFDDRLRFLNFRNCVARLHEHRCIPVLNENDTIAVEELRFGDNDLLAGLASNALRAEALVLLTGVEGLLDGAGDVVDLVDDVIGFRDLVRTEKSSWGSGGMSSKLEAARVVTEAGEVAVVASGKVKDVLPRILSGERIGTVFAPAGRKLDSRQRWIGLTARPAGAVTIDDGAAKALVDRGKSLLATGITTMTGRFDRGDVLLVRDAAGRELGRGLTNYSADELRLIAGKKTAEFEKLLGRPGYAAVIHRDNLVVLNGTAAG